MPFTFACPNCGVERLVEDRFDGTQGPCATCGKVILVTRPAAPVPAERRARARTRAAGPTEKSVRILLAALTLIVVAGTFFGWLVVTVVLPQLESIRSLTRQSRCAANLTRIAVALRAYHQDYGCFPPAITRDDKGQAMHSWRVLLLPYLGEPELYAMYDRNEPWNGPNNSSLASRMPDVYLDLGDSLGVAGGITCFVAVVGDGTVFPRTGVGRLSQIPDGPADTIMVVEMSDSKVNWTEPMDMQVTQMTFSLAPGPGWRMRASHGDGPHVLAADGAVYRLRPAAPSSQLRALVTVAGGETVNWNAIAERHQD